MQEKPSVTIGIPVYNEEKYLAATIQSAINQTYKNIQIIISDNCSTDKSFEIASRFAEEYDRISLVKQEKNIGAIDNFKFPLSKATSKYFIWLGAHDIILPGYIEEAVNYLEKNNSTVLVYPEGEAIDILGNFVDKLEGDYDTNSWPSKKRMLKIAENMNNGYIIHGLFRTEILRKIPFENVFATDFLVVMIASAYGNVSKLPYLGFQRRIVRKETHAEQTERHVQYGMFKKSDINPFSLFVARLIANIFKLKVFSLSEKVNLVLKLKKIYSNRFKVTWKEILRLLFFK